MITIPNENFSELVEKKSKFIANVFYVESVKQAEEKLKEIKKKYYDARHNCISYRVIENGIIVEKASDDGEPSGTAGGPMLNILQKNDICNVLVVVTRYFGGILLGTGGLVRAYSEVTQDVIKKSEKAEIKQAIEYEVEIEYSNLEALKYYCRKNDILVQNLQYSNSINCNLEINEDFNSKFLKDIEKKTVNVLEYKLKCDKKIKIGKNFQKTIAI